MYMNEGAGVTVRVHTCRGATADVLKVFTETLVEVGQSGEG